MGQRPSRVPDHMRPGGRGTVSLDGSPSIPIPFHACRSWDFTPEDDLGTLAAVPEAVLQGILEWGTIRDIGNWTAVCRRALQTALSETLWRALCVTRFRTDLPNAPSLQSYCSVYRILSRHRRLLGLWRVTDDWPYGDVLEVAWDGGGLVAHILHRDVSPLLTITFQDPKDGQIAVQTQFALHWHLEEDDGEIDENTGVPLCTASWLLMDHTVAGIPQPVWEVEWNPNAPTGSSIPGPRHPLLRQALQCCNKMQSSHLRYVMTLAKLSAVTDPIAQAQTLRLVTPATVPKAQLPAPGLYHGNYGHIYGPRAVEAISVVYATFPVDQVWEPSEDLTHTIIAASFCAANSDSIFSSSSSSPSSSEQAPSECWLLGIKATGDEHVPMGQLSFRVRVAPDGFAAGDGAHGEWAGLGQLALPGFKGSYWNTGTLRMEASDQFSFTWASNHQVTVHFYPIAVQRANER
jgi:hypothetical protein